MYSNSSGSVLPFVSFWNLKSLYFTCSLSFSFIASLALIHCHSLSFVSTCYHSLSRVVTGYTTCCHSLPLVVPLAFARFHSLLLDVPLVYLFINNRFISWKCLKLTPEAYNKFHVSKNFLCLDCAFKNLSLYQIFNWPQV